MDVLGKELEDFRGPEPCFGGAIVLVDVLAFWDDEVLQQWT